MPAGGRRRASSCVTGRPVRFKTTLTNCVAYPVLQSRGWTETQGEYDWDIYWADVHSLGVDSDFDHGRLREGQRINHFPRHTELSRKDLLAKNVKRAARAAERDGGQGRLYDFLPATFVLPAEYTLFAEEFRRAPGAMWIMKPCGRARGSGIFLVDRLSQVAAWIREEKAAAQFKERFEGYVVSRYIERPLLIGGRKFDLRIYVLVLSFQPLVVYLHRGGFCRLSAGAYARDRTGPEDLHLHVTNIAIQRQQAAFEPGTCMKWPLRSLRLHVLGTRGAAAADALFGAVQGVVLRSLLAVQRVVTQDRHSFELYGYDILIDEDLKPWLIEVNASPSLGVDTAADHRLKFELVADCLALVDLEGRLGGRLPPSYGGWGPRALVEYDLIWSGQGPVRPHPAVASLLGCAVPVSAENQGRVYGEGPGLQQQAAAPPEPAATGGIPEACSGSGAVTPQQRA